MESGITKNVENENDISIISQTKSVYDLIQLVNICQTRGAFTLDEASELYNSVKHFDKENKDTITKEDQKQSIILFINSIYKSQKNGILELEEAHLAWECIKSFTKKDEIEINEDI
jgi:flagellar motor component MotA